jgi:hypothetical protein
LRGLLFFAFFFCALSASGQATYTAASCNYHDVNACINSDASGSCSPSRHTVISNDEVIIPAGTCTWTTSLATPSGVGFYITGNGTLNSAEGLCSSVTCGAGTATTTLILNTSTVTPLFEISGLTPSSALMRISLLNVNPEAGAGTNSQSYALAYFLGTCTTSSPYCASIRVDNITFTGWANIVEGGLNNTVNIFGVFDHITITETATSVNEPLVQIQYPSWQGVGDYGDNSFASADTYGTAQQIVIENSILTSARSTENDTSAGSQGGSRATCRFNQFNNGYIQCTAHGTGWLSRFRGMRQEETYRNVFNNGTAALDTTTGYGSGTGILWGNSYSSTSPGFYNGYFSMGALPRDFHSVTPFFYCDGAQPYDTNDGTVYDSGIITAGGSAGIMSDSTKTWTTNQWADAGNPYSVHDVTQNVGSAIVSNTATQLTTQGVDGYFTFTVGDSYQILRASKCIDQIAYSGGTLYSGTTPTPVSAANQTLDPIYEWMDSHSGTGGGPSYPIEVSGNRFLANRDYYEESLSQSAQTSATSPFNGSSGNGHGTLAFRPTTCTPHVGYWATDQGNWNSASTGGQGELFLCTATNTWTLSYTPLAYPHPLIAGGGGGPATIPCVKCFTENMEEQNETGN